MQSAEIPKNIVKHKKRVQELRNSNPGFRELYDDYLEIIHLIETMKLSESQTRELHELRQSLEMEITEALQS